MDDQSLVQVNITIKSGERLIHFTTKSFSTSSSARFIQTEVRDVDAGTWVYKQLLFNFSQNIVYRQLHKGTTSLSLAKTVTLSWKIRMDKSQFYKAVPTRSSLNKLSQILNSSISKAM